MNRVYNFSAGPAVPPAAFEVQRDRVLKDQKATACEKVRRTAALFPSRYGRTGTGQRGKEARSGQPDRAGIAGAA